MRKKRKILIVGKVREFDEVAWKRLILAYAYYLHDEHTKQAEAATAPHTDDAGECTP
ncbi:MAG TPA: hypothetical protein VJR27_05920 [Candidatus Saccharimonadales bacterium]|nr:hypothetical protein [Candidatus Saccharimonadales bacterium]